MTIRVFVAELIWWDNLEVIAYWRLATVMSLRISCSKELIKNKFFIPKYRTENVSFKNVFEQHWIERSRDLYVTQ